MIAKPKSEMGKIVLMVVVLVVVVGWMAFPRAARKMQWQPEMPQAPVEREVKIGGLKERVLKMREEAVNAEAPELPGGEAGGGAAREGAAQELPPDEKLGDPEAAAVPLDPELREQIRRLVEEARSGVENFNEMLPEFERVEEVDRELLFKVMDDRKWPRAAHDIKSEADVFHHVFSFIRSHTDRELREMAREEGELAYYQMLGNPEPHRGRVVDFRGRFVRVYQLFEWPVGETAKLPNTSGVRTTALCYCVGGGERGQIHLLLMVTDPRKFTSDDKIRCPAVFVKRWAGQMPNGDWVFFPLLVAREFKPLAKPRDRATELVIVGVAIFAVIGLIVIFFAARYEFSHSAEARAHLKDRLKANRDKRIEEARKRGKPMPWEKKPAEPSDAAAPAEGDKPAEEKAEPQAEKGSGEAQDSGPGTATEG